MKTLGILALVAIACSGSVFAGAVGPNPGTPVPDVGASALLLGIGVSVLGLIRRRIQ